MTNTALTAANIRYLLAIKRLYNNEGVKGMDLADELGLSRASVHNMMDTFISMKIIRRGKQGEVFFTEYGETLADKYESYHERVRERILPDEKIQVDLDKAICAFLAEMPENMLDEL